MTAVEVLPSGNGWRVDGTEFRYGYGLHSTADRFFIRKPADLIDLYIDLCPTFQHGRIVELGIAAGGSTALLGLLTRPTKLVACELESEPVEALGQFIDAHGLRDTVHPYFGVDQADTARIAEIVDEEFGTEPLDLVIDDASHFHEETKTSFELLFPRLRPGGLYIIEDWAHNELEADAVWEVLADESSQWHTMVKDRVHEANSGDEPPVLPIPLSRLAVQLMLICARSSRWVSELRVNSHWVGVTRGTDESRDGLDLAELCHDHWGWFVP